MQTPEEFKAEERANLDRLDRFARARYVQRNRDEDDEVLAVVVTAEGEDIKLTLGDLARLLGIAERERRLREAADAVKAAVHAAAATVKRLS